MVGRVVLASAVTERSPLTTASPPFDFHLLTPPVAFESGVLSARRFQRHEQCRPDHVTERLQMTYKVRHAAAE
jgi:hypothetical protein